MATSAGEAEERGQARADPLRTEFFEQELVATGWEVQLTATTNNLEAALLKEAKRGNSLDAMVGEFVLKVEAAAGVSSP